MGTNYFRIPNEVDMIRRKDTLIKRITDIELTPELINSEFSDVILDNIPSQYSGVLAVNSFNTVSPWEEFIDGMKVHLGKQSLGWKFLWNFHNNRYYSNKKELFAFIRSGRVLDEYGELIPNEKFIKEALEWGEPDGHIFNEEYLQTHPSERSIFSTSENFSKIIDGLVVSAHDEFC